MRRLENAYPIYDLDSEARFAVLDRWIAGIPRVLTFGRLGLFAHDNTHHALHMGYAAARACAPTGRLTMESGREHRREFASHVVED